MRYWRKPSGRIVLFTKVQAGAKLSHAKHGHSSYSGGVDEAYRNSNSSVPWEASQLLQINEGRTWSSSLSVLTSSQRVLRRVLNDRTRVPLRKIGALLISLVGNACRFGSVVKFSPPVEETVFFLLLVSSTTPSRTVQILDSAFQD